MPDKNFTFASVITKLYKYTETLQRVFNELEETFSTLKESSGEVSGENFIWLVWCHFDKSYNIRSQRKFFMDYFARLNIAYATNPIKLLAECEKSRHSKFGLLAKDEYIKEGPSAVRNENQSG